MISKDNILEYETRKKIYDCINKHPGMHLSKISRVTGVPRSTLSYHLRFLNKKELITSKQKGRYKRFYVFENISAKDKEILELLRQDTPCKIILFFYLNMICSQIELSKSLNRKPTTIEFHLKKMIEIGIIAPVVVENGLILRHKNSCYIMGRRPVKSEIIYGFKNQDALLHVHRLIHKYGGSFPDQKTNSELINYIQDIQISDKLPKHIFVTDFKTAIDKVTEKLYAVLPHPYHV